MPPVMENSKLSLLLIFILPLSTMAQNQEIAEAKLIFSLPEKWRLAQNAGTLDDGLVQYFYYREPIKTEDGLDAHPATIFILEKTKGRELSALVSGDINREKSGRLSKGKFGAVEDLKVDGRESKRIVVETEDSGFKLRTWFYYFINNDVFVKLILNTIREPNPAEEEQQSIVNSIKLD